jgi:hypothetical protein
MEPLTEKERKANGNWSKKKNRPKSYLNLRKERLGKTREEGPFRREFGAITKEALSLNLLWFLVLLPPILILHMSMLLASTAPQALLRPRIEP